ncbi:MAG: hypothetical protein CMM02_09815 [Rhodopirellula sp.]|nr:hypothetical protein [Rhodopirellula sp.]|tara:strand:- start:3078 stop:3383 length:306 start_codon:yes stop_codon:yes gene_type:complete
MKKNILNTLLIFFIIILLSFTMILFTNKSINVEKFNRNIIPQLEKDMIKYNRNIIPPQLEKDMIKYNRNIIPQLEKDMIKFIKPTTTEYDNRFYLLNKINL